jgi:Leucine-rich repeat (LRR) protein
MFKIILGLLTILFGFSLQAQRGTNASELSPQELRQKKYEDSMQKMRDDFARDFDATAYFKRQREIKLKNDSIQLNETLEYFHQIEPFADTFTFLAIQSSALAVFPNSIKNFKNLKTLSLRRCPSVHLEALFEQIKDLPNLTELQIVFSEKAKLPENIGLLKRVRNLDLNGNKLNELPIGLSNMTSLETINLHNNPYLDMDNACQILAKTASLKSVKLSGCKIVTLSDNLGKLSQINELDLNLNSIEVLPTGLDGLKNLRSLNLSKNSKLNTIQIYSSLSSIPGLEELNMSDCGLTEVNAGIGTMTKLKKLILTNNPIKKLASEIGNLTQLEELYIGAGLLQKERVPLTELPSAFGQCISLRKLDLRMCQLISLPNSFTSLKNLSYLDISWNQLNKFPNSLITLPSLNYLDLSNNKINEIPSDIGQLALSLETLLIEANFYSPYNEKINKLPPSLARCKNLKRLSLKDQVYETLPDRFWFDLTRLEDLNLMGALLQEVPDAIENLTELKSLNLKSNEIKKISPSITKLKKLENFNISYNPDINASELLQYILEMKQLKMVDLSYNDIKRELMEPVASQMKQTKFIKLETKDSPAYEKPKRR